MAAPALREQTNSAFVDACALAAVDAAAARHRGLEVNVGGVSLSFYRARDGTVTCVETACPHAGHRLCDGYAADPGDVPPAPGSLVLFWSALVAHEVRPAHAERTYFESAEKSTATTGATCWSQMPKSAYPSAAACRYTTLSAEPTASEVPSGANASAATAALAASSVIVRACLAAPSAPAAASAGAGPSPSRRATVSAWRRGCIGPDFILWQNKTGAFSFCGWQQFNP